MKAFLEGLLVVAPLLVTAAWVLAGPTPPIALGVAVTAGTAASIAIDNIVRGAA